MTKKISQIVKEYVYTVEEYVRFCIEHNLIPEEPPPRNEKRRKKQERACVRECQRLERY